ncbi:hypothetical protein Nepgr_025435 [Nepenthes gracilis]|uniref:Uncharacterized protein n=1 Tax=Nepenthes gracilis TaxID=150966 RepID=A0AAD3XZI1_NEPGR|nr:hypothetical protein Nepgr_025435 [Nepenthes gracilis]
MLGIILSLHTSMDARATICELEYGGRQCHPTRHLLAPTQATNQAWHDWCEPGYERGRQLTKVMVHQVWTLVVAILCASADEVIGGSVCCRGGNTLGKRNSCGNIL